MPGYDLVDILKEILQEFRHHAIGKVNVRVYEIRDQFVSQIGSTNTPLSVTNDITQSSRGGTQNVGCSRKFNFLSKTIFNKRYQLLWVPEHFGKISFLQKI